MRERHNLIGAATLAAALAATASGWAQSQPGMPRGEFVPYALDSGKQANPEPQARSVSALYANVEGADWTRLYFSQITLEPGSVIRFISLLDGEEQELDAAGAAMWGNTSAYFNGDTVLIELVAGPGTTQNRFVLEKLAVELPASPISNHCTPPLCGICDTDARVPSTENWAGRLMPVGCSAAIYNEQSCGVTAGHCILSNLVMQFNVPNSTGGCSPQNPPVADQFPVTGQISLNGGVGNDWAALTIGTNNLGQTPYQRFGEFRPIASSVPTSGAIDIWGYGVSETCTLSQVQQHSTGNITSVSGTAINHNADTTCGNSGSSMLQNGEIIGIVSHCGQPCPPSTNIATRIDRPAFVAARDDLCAAPEDVFVPGDYSTIQAAINAVSSGSVITVAPGVYPEAINFNGKNVTVIASGGRGVTTIDATGLGASVVRFSNGESSQAVLQGFTLTGGAGSNVSIGGNPYVLGGGIYVAGASPTIVDCVVANNSAQFGGGVFNNGASPTFEGCIFAENTSNPSSGGGVFNFSGSSAQFIDCMFIANSAVANGGGMSNQASSPSVSGSQFIGNQAGGSGGAVRNIQSSAGTFTGCSFESNAAGTNGGAFINEESAGTLIANSDFCENAPNHIFGGFTDGGGNAFLADCPGAPDCPADLDGDGLVGLGDLSILLTNFGTAGGATHEMGDINGDGNVDLADLSMLLEDFGAPCD